MTANPVPNRAGMVAFNRVGEVLIISGLTNPKIWVFPKGHIEVNEASYEAAERECREETGIRAIVDTGEILGQTSYRYAGEDVIVEWWSGLATRPEPNSRQDHSRTVRFVPWPIALEMLSFGSMRNLLRKALCLEENPEDRTENAEILLTDPREEIR